MPLYEYFCQECGKKFEELVNGDKVPACPFCGARNCNKLISCCARHKSDGKFSGDEYASTAGGGGCAGCSGGNCSACGR